MLARLGAWVESRIPTGAVREMLAHKTVPLHRHTIWSYLGGMTLFFFLVQLFTGILLMLYYRPSAGEAFESIQFLMTQVPFGWLIRSIHSWSANLMIAAALTHLFSVLLLRAYRPPRELTWVSGFLVLCLALGFGFSGYLLPWNRLAFFATRVGTDIAGSVPVVGSFMLRFLRGGDYVTGGTLSRFYGWHVAILPAITTFLLGLHLLLVQRHGMSLPPSVEKRGGSVPTMRFMPDFLLRDLFGWTLALGLLAALAALAPWELGEKADPFGPAPANIRPEWYFMFLFETLKHIPGGEILGIENEAIFVMFTGAVGLVALLLPFLDRFREPGWKSALVPVLGVAAMGYITIMTAVGYKAWWPVGAAVLLYAVASLAGRTMHVAAERRG